MHPAVDEPGGARWRGVPDLACLRLCIAMRNGKIAWQVSFLPRHVPGSAARPRCRTLPSDPSVATSGFWAGIRFCTEGGSRVQTSFWAKSEIGTRTSVWAISALGPTTKFGLRSYFGPQQKKTGSDPHLVHNQVRSKNMQLGSDASETGIRPIPRMVGIVPSMVGVAP